MKTAVLHKRHFTGQQQAKVPASLQGPKTLAIENNKLAHKDFAIFLVGVFVGAWLLRCLGAWIGRESIRLQQAPGKFITYEEQYRELHNQVGPNSFFRIP